MHPVREKLSQIWTNIQGYLFAFLEEEVGPLTQAHQEVVKVLELRGHLPKGVPPRSLCPVTRGRRIVQRRNAVVLRGRLWPRRC
jgi:hypothetical protein